MSIEKETKRNFSKIFTQSNWTNFKNIAEYYFDTAAHIKNKDIAAPKKYLLRLRNAQKRLFLGIGSELILKAYYLKQGYSINSWKDGRFRKPYKIDSILKDELDPTNAITMNQLIQNLNKVSDFKVSKTINKGFRIAKVFRNKEAHITVSKHKFDPEEYTSIEKCLIKFYQNAFSQNLDFQISMKAKEKGKFKLA